MKQQHDIISALDAFIRKYYKNLLIRGILYAVGLVAAIFLAAVLLEYFGWMSSVGRGLVFWLGLAAVLAALAWLVVRPLLKMYGLGKRISREQAAVIIGRHFPEVSDKLLNLLQLNAQLSTADSQLLQAAIEQKTVQLKPVPMLNAINLHANSRYLKYALPPLAVIAILLIATPQTVTEPSKRIVNYGTAYERPAPFRFLILNEGLAVSQGDDFTLQVVTEGDAVPAEAFVIVDGRRHKLIAEGSRQAPQFSYTFSKVSRSMVFYLDGGGVTSPEYTLEMMPNPSVISFRMLLSYPAYTGRESETVLNLGDAAVPEGTQVRWLFQTQDADSLAFIFHDSRYIISPDANGRVEVSRRVMDNTDYAFTVRNGSAIADTLRYTLSAIKDAAPMIAVDEMADSLYPDRHIFRGRVKDDYGFSKLVFVHKTDNPADTSRNAVSEAEIALDGGASQEFYFSFNAAELTLAPGDVLSYWFEVSDNDAIHGPKTSRSQVFEIKVPTADELDSLLEQSSSDVRQSAENQMSELKRLQEEINEMMRKLVEKKDLGWQEKKELEQIAEKQKQVRQMMQQMQQQLEQLKMDNAEIEKQLDQNIELMKRLEIEKKVEQTIQRMDKLAQEQRDVSRETEQARNKDRDELLQKQQAVDEKFQQLKQDIDQIKQDYKELDPSTEFRVPQELEQQVEQQQKEARQSLQKGKNKDASQKQSGAAESMEKLSEALAEAEVDAEQQDLAEDAEEVRQLLKNLVRLSFNQEELITDLGATYIQDPRYQTIISRQNRIRDDFRGVEDSLRSMARRQVRVASAISKDLAEVNNGITRSLNGLLDMNQSFYGNYRNTVAATSMQYSMTSLNNLALVLAESLDQMQSDMRQNNQKKRSGQCKKSGKSGQQCSNPGKKPSPKSMRQMQQELNRQMEALKKQLDKQGKKPGGRHQIGQGQSMSEEFAKMAAQQEMIRRMMQEYGQELKEGDAGNGKLAREIDQMMRQMEQTETDLVNRTITKQTITRQQQIMTRLLEHEKAEMQREREERRESHEAKDLYSQPSPEEMEKYNRQARPADDQLRTVPPTLQPYYRQKVNDYFFH